MSNRTRFTALATMLAVLSVLMVAGRVLAASETPIDELHRSVQKFAPPTYTLPSKVMCACAHNGYLSRAAGYLNSTIVDNGSYRTVEVLCVYQGYSQSGQPAFTAACGDYVLLKK